ncbi:hypothetical protein HYH02_008804 [Chlamydomonas schloesseri]|uniref:Uncharacterized protein n=1 Tax=Chlamydomonas schloesseri TaxID=2026947 RepID=A0A835WDL5_9CHLO|nr:hypothetical protein HYH02_008804 [Chlamydomonas schloesseri]|eukprot:KAG2445339.1 hypothetical protein HYH02_008804 [Chlamydomonas schloesseri]
MGASESKPPNNPILARIEQEAVRAAVPRGLKDERSRQLEYDLNWCYNRNNWFFTIGGLVVGVTLGYSMRSVQPIAWAAILAPAADWFYEQHACAELQEAYNEHQKRLKDEARARAEAAKAEVREHYAQYMAAEAAGAGGSGGGGGGGYSGPKGGSSVGGSGLAPSNLSSGSGIGGGGGGGGGLAGAGMATGAGAGAGVGAGTESGAGVGATRRGWWPWSGAGSKA